jgi:hypothetical protein
LDVNTSPDPSHYVADLDSYYRPPASVPTVHPHFRTSVSAASGAQTLPEYHQSAITDTESQQPHETLVACRDNGFPRRSTGLSFTFWEQLNGKSKNRIGWLSSLKAVVTCTCKPEPSIPYLAIDFLPFYRAQCSSHSCADRLGGTSLAWESTCSPLSTWVS